MNSRILLTGAAFVATLGLSACNKTETANDTAPAVNADMVGNDIVANDVALNDSLANDVDADENQHLIDPHADATAKNTN